MPRPFQSFSLIERVCSFASCLLLHVREGDPTAAPENARAPPIGSCLETRVTESPFHLALPSLSQCPSVPGHGLGYGRPFSLAARNSVDTPDTHPDFKTLPCPCMRLAFHSCVSVTAAYLAPASFDLWTCRQSLYTILSTRDVETVNPVGSQTHLSPPKSPSSSLLSTPC